jgi:hypothetical protein
MQHKVEARLVTCILDPFKSSYGFIYEGYSQLCTVSDITGVCYLLLYVCVYFVYVKFIRHT